MSTPAPAPVSDAQVLALIAAEARRATRTGDLAALGAFVLGLLEAGGRL